MKDAIFDVLNKLFAMVFIYCSVYLIFEIIGLSATWLVDFNDLAIIVALAALIIIIIQGIIVHNLIKYLPRAWTIIFVISAVCIGFGSLISMVTVYGVVIIAGGIPGVTACLDPARTSRWMKDVMDIKEDSGFLVGLSIGMVLTLAFVQQVAFYTCSIKIVAFAVLLIISAIWVLLRFLLINKQPTTETTEDVRRAKTGPIMDARRFWDVKPIERTSSIFNLLTWLVFPVFLAIVLRELAIPTSFGTGITIPSTMFAMLGSLIGGTVLAVVFQVLKARIRIMHNLPRIFIIVLAITLPLVLIDSPLISGWAALTGRMVMLFSIPVISVGVYASPAPDLRDIGLNWWRGFVNAGSSLLLVLIILFYSENLGDIFDMIMYVACFVLALSFFIDYLIDVGFAGNNGASVKQGSEKITKVTEK